MRTEKKIHFHKKSGGSSISCVGQHIFEQLRDNNYDIKAKDLDKYDEDFIQPVEIGIIYGLVRDLKKIYRYSCKIAGLVCEKELTPYEILLIKEAQLMEIWVPSDYVAQFFIKAGFEKKIEVVPHGVEEFPLANPSLKKESNEFKGLMIFNSYGRLNDHVLRKNPFKAIEAVNSLENISLKLRTKHQKYYDKVNLKKVEFAEEYIEDLTDLYRDCDFLLYPSDSEGFGLVGLEALMRGIPLISTKTGNEYLDENVSYIEIKMPVTAEGIKEAIKEMTDNYSKYKGKAIEQREYIYEKNSWKKVGERVENAIDNMLKKKVF